MEIKKERQEDGSECPCWARCGFFRIRSTCIGVVDHFNVLLPSLAFFSQQFRLVVWFVFTNIFFLKMLFFSSTLLLESNKNSNIVNRYPFIRLLICFCLSVILKIWYAMEMSWHWQGASKIWYFGALDSSICKKISIKLPHQTFPIVKVILDVPEVHFCSTFLMKLKWSLLNRSVSLLQKLQMALLWWA